MISLRTLNASNPKEFYIDLDNPDEEDIRAAISNPSLMYGMGKYYDVCIWATESDKVTSLSFYLGIPMVAMVVFRDHKHEEHIRTSNERRDHYVVIPDSAPDEYLRVPHNYFVDRQSAIDSALVFFKSRGSRFAPDDQVSDYDIPWISWLDDDCSDPFTAALEECVKEQKTQTT